MRASNPQIIIRPFRMDTDIQPLLELRIAIEAVDQVGTETSERALRAEFNWHGHLPQEDRWVVQTSEAPEKFLGHAWVFRQTGKRSILHVAVHPSYRRRSIGTELLKKVIVRCREMNADQIVAGAEVKHDAGAAFLQKNRFSPVGHNRHLIAPADTKIALPQWPAGFKVRTYAEMDAMSYVVDACNACYADMWGHGQNTELSTIKSFSEAMDSFPNYFVPEGMFVLFAPNDDVAGICFARLEAVENDAVRKVIDSPGVVPNFRYLKLQRQLVLTTMHWLNTLAEGEFHILSWGDTPDVVVIYEALGFALNTDDYSIEYLLESED